MNRFSSSKLGLIALAALSLGTSVGCGGSKYVITGGMFPDEYVPKVGTNQFNDGVFNVTINKIQNGAMGTNFAMELTVRNVGAEAAEFDPGEVELTVPETGMSYFHISKDKQIVSMPVGFNVAMKTSLKPGQAVAQTLWFQTPQGAAEAKTLKVTYKAQTLIFPPSAPAASK